jgi:hypothetical protein
MRSKHARAFTRLVNVGMGCRTGDVLELSDTWISGSMGMVEIVTTYLKMRDDLRKWPKSVQRKFKDKEECSPIHQ